MFERISFRAQSRQVGFTQAPAPGEHFGEAEAGQQGLRNKPVRIGQIVLLEKNSNLPRLTIWRRRQRSMLRPPR